MIAAMRAVLFASAGQTQKAEEQIRIVVEKESYGHFHHASFLIACAYARLHQADKALHWLNYTAETGFPNVTLFENVPEFAPLRSDPRYAALIARWKKHSDAMRAIE
jgi:hypothetical protein